MSSQRFLAGLYFVCSITKPLMARTVDVAGVRELLGRGAQLVEVLPAQEYEELHLPAAISLPLKEIKQRIDSSPYGYALVLAERVVLGRVRRSRLQDAPAGAHAAQLMEPGPSTSRPHVAPGELAAQLRRAGASSAILTTPEGELLGIVPASDLPRET